MEVIAVEAEVAASVVAFGAAALEEDSVEVSVADEAGSVVAAAVSVAGPEEAGDTEEASVEAAAASRAAEKAARRHQLGINVSENKCMQNRNKYTSFFACMNNLKTKITQQYVY